MNKKRIAASITSLGLALTAGASIVSAADTVNYQASADYSTIQGTNQWQYEKLSGTTYSKLTYQTGASRWDNGGTYPWITANAQHPGNDADSVRTWIAPANGTITITGAVEKGSADGDGILATIKKDDTTLWSQKVQSTTGVTPSGVSKIAVQKGTAIHFIVNRVGSISFDHTLWNPAIAFTPAADVPDDHSLSIVEFGAVANDGKDDYAAVNAAITAARAQGKDVYVPAGTFQLSDIINVNSVTLKGAGKDKSILTSTNPERGSIDLTGTSPALRDLKHEYATVVPRGNGENEKNSITVRSATNFTIDQVLVNKASTAGILVKESTGGTITNNTVQNTNADGIHMTGGSSGITVQSNLVQHVGDDTIAVVSYGTDLDAAGRPEATHNIRILNNDVGYDSGARGITVVGGHDVWIESNSIQRTQMAGIYIATEGKYQTQPVNNITVNNNTLDSTAQKPTGGHAEMLVYGGYSANTNDIVIDNITFTGNTSRNATKFPAGVWGSAKVGNVTFINTTIINAPYPEKYKFENGIVTWEGTKVFPK
ncbi:right-handed parallel beta-helix repeat-containing protein [Paenibacillus wulumuqiensis]|uniref:right-handed parallel beta-helix repeat-containing protein n=1 Tax=Paenibacillus wulumuqiensis TaxID=1567107 RepID=UPI0006198B6A|nr:right-handed parallel beta-helix repeat-containing protein [Paenibacillus wulumuqiensis]